MKLAPGCFYGNALKSHLVAGFSLIETTYAPNLRIPTHAHECAYLCFVVRGTYTETYGGRTRTCKPSTLILHPPGEMHSDRFDNGGGRCFNVQVEPLVLERVREHTRILDSPAEFHRASLAHLAMKLYREFGAIDETSALVVEGLALEILGEASRRSLKSSNRRPPRWLGQVREILHANFSTNLTLATIAASVGVHPVHLARAFRQRFRLTVGEYVRQLRIEFACRELCQTEKPLVDIGSEAGFCSQSHFSTVFKRHTGLSPGEYRAISSAR
jgi:AraC family transcriptional regulator